MQTHAGHACHSLYPQFALDNPVTLTVTSDAVHAERLGEL